MSEPGGLVDSLSGAARSLVETVQVRLSLFANELEEQGARYAHVAMLWAVGGFCAGVAVILASMFLVVVFWDSHPLTVLGLLTGFFAIAAVAAIMFARSLMSSRPRPFADTLAELERDRQALERTRRSA
jgi:uncharacterized membrane protein YqjE